MSIYRHLFYSLLLAVLLCPVIADAQFFPPIKEKTVTGGVAVYKELDFAKSYLFDVNLASEYRIRTWFSFGIEGSVLKFTSHDYSQLGVGVRPITRIFFFSRSKWELFAEGKGGVTVMLPPNRNQLFNYTFTGSLGGDVQLSKYSRFRISSSYYHFSNAKPKGDVINPTFDGVGLSISFLHIISE